MEITTKIKFLSIIFFKKKLEYNKASIFIEPEDGFGNEETEFAKSLGIRILCNT
ncbi:MAG: hypothetical protein LBS15_01485 [Endomicrobium sp.]|jgi:hypothetical protein|nr:hypothetical protein [Endomicrobium sp.]